MALCKNYTKTESHFDGVLELKDAYYRVESISGSKQNISFVVSISKKLNDKQIEITSAQYSFVPSMDNKNFIAQAYAHLKTLPEFAGATDC